MTAANVNIVIGTTDHWDTSTAPDECRIDGRLRGVRLVVASVPTPRSVVTAGTRVATAPGTYAEIEIIAEDGSTGSGRVAIVPPSGVPLLAATAPNSIADAVVYMQNGEIRVGGGGGGSVVQSGLPTLATGQRVGVELLLINTVPHVQFWIDQAEVGDPVEIDKGAWHLGWGAANNVAAAYLHCDRDDMPRMPAGRQAWGAAARVADVGGYTPPACRWSGSLSNPTFMAVDAHGDVVTNAAANDACAYGGVGMSVTARPAPDLVYAEIGRRGGTQSRVGLAIADVHGNTTRPGDSSASWVYDLVSGNKVHLGAPNACGGAVAAGGRLGFVLKRSTGQLWFLPSGVIAEGDPERGTGASFSGLVGTLSIIGSIRSGALRIYTHAREQLYRPAYATAWDGADALPQQHYRDRLANDPYIRRGVWFSVPWGGNRRGETIGAIEIANAGGEYDGICDGDLRGQDVTVYDGTADTLLPLAKGTVDSIESQGERTLRVLVQDATAVLDTRLEQRCGAIGNPRLVPPRALEGASLHFEVCDHPLFRMTLTSAGLSVSNWTYANADVCNGFVRTVNPAGDAQRANLTVYENRGSLDIVNSDFSSWSGDNPTSWTVSESSPLTVITQVGSAARFLKSSPATLYARHTIRSLFPGELYFVRLKVSAYVSGQLTVGAFSNTFGLLGSNTAIQGPGTWYTLVDATGWADGGRFQMQAVSSCDITVDEVEVINVGFTHFANLAIPYLLHGLGSVPETAVAPLPGDFGNASTVGYLSDRQPTIRQVLGDLMSQWIADYYPTADGRIACVRMRAPELDGGVEDLFEHQGKGPMTASDDLAPSLTDSAMVQRAIQPYSTGELAGAVDPFAIPSLTNGHGSIKLNLLAVPSFTDPRRFHPFYSHAFGAPPLPRWEPVTSSSSGVSYNGDRELRVLHDGYYVRRRFYRRNYRNDVVRGLDPGVTLKVWHSRHGLAGGKQLLLVDMQRNSRSSLTELLFWG